MDNERRQMKDEANFNEKLLRGVQGGGILEKRPPGRRRQANIYLTKHQMRLLSNILSHVEENIFYDEEYFLSWVIEINGNEMIIGDREKKAIKVMLKRLYGGIYG